LVEVIDLLELIDIEGLVEVELTLVVKGAADQLALAQGEGVEEAETEQNNLLII